MTPVIEARLAAVGARSGEIDERFILGSGRGGQKIQKTSSCVWLRHRPTGIEVRCQDERSQAANRERAWDELCGRLEQRVKKEAAANLSDRELERRRNRKKSFGQKQQMIQSKRHRSKTKSGRGKVGYD